MGSIYFEHPIMPVLRNCNCGVDTVTYCISYIGNLLRGSSDSPPAVTSFQNWLRQSLPCVISVAGYTSLLQVLTSGRSGVARPAAENCNSTTGQPATPARLHDARLSLPLSIYMLYIHRVQEVGNEWPLAWPPRIL